MDITGLTRRTILATGLAGLAGAAFPFRRALAAYPEHPMTWIVAYAAGGGSDTLARILAEAMSPKLGQAIVIENRPGGATNIGGIVKLLGESRRLDELDGGRAGLGYAAALMPQTSCHAWKAARRGSRLQAFGGGAGGRGC
jgi:hypothetical protein